MARRYSTREQRRAEETSRGSRAASAAGRSRAASRATEGPKRSIPNTRTRSQQTFRQGPPPTTKKPAPTVGMLRRETAAETKARQQKQASNKARARRVQETGRGGVRTLDRTKRRGSTTLSYSNREINTPKSGKRSVTVSSFDALRRRTTSRLPKPPSAAAQRAERAKMRKARRSR